MISLISNSNNWSSFKNAKYPWRVTIQTVPSSGKICYCRLRNPNI